MKDFSWPVLGPEFWSVFAVLYAAALIGALALTPYVLRLVKSSSKPVKASPRKIAIAGFVQNAVLFAIVTAGGLLLARAVGLKATPDIDAWLAGGLDANAVHALAWAAILGAGLGMVLLLADLALLPRLPALLNLARKASLWENFAACFYGGVNEELLTRLLGVSGVAWIFARVSNAPTAHPPAAAAFWWAIAIMSVLFGLGHLPAARAVAGRLTPLIVLRSLVLNAVVAVPCGWLFWRYGLEAAIVVHFTVDIVYHVIGTALLKLNDRIRIFPWFPRPEA
ncbi:MAG TPA: CPBP family glutamic-type intramembrane protease [Caulobacteraceae bacterium]|jgi:hypothetical protein|nr:CPBP family glutamic-type intramembrane protease [Caulobacteraceae bacterium]